MKAWKIIYIFNKKKKATELLKDLIKEHPGARYRVGRLLKKLSGKIYKQERGEWQGRIYRRHLHKGE